MKTVGTEKERDEAKEGSSSCPTGSHRSGRREGKNGV